jgi:Flp pilus assembly protein TadB
MNAGALAAAGMPAGAAAAAAADAAERRNREEEILTAYSQQELDENREFKILRSAAAEFKKPERLREILDEEARVGWVMVEKFDDSRIRLKRPPDASQGDSHSGIDPWRSQIGQTSSQREAKIAMVIVGVVLAVMAAVAVAVLAVVGAPV